MEGNVGDDVLIELIAPASERLQGSLAAYGPAEFQRRVARVAGASNGTEHLVLPITAVQRQHLAQHQRGIMLTISSAVTIQTHVQGLER